MIYAKKAHKWAARREMIDATPLSDVISSDLEGIEKHSGVDIAGDIETGGRTLKEEELAVLLVMY
ncbi:hypothetical protein [Xenorhabdus hominickii]|uniref:Integrase n=1 Tax=Xenorhabdus hominickii TaxID=351679 RepID=A0A2G0Q3B1_XENHO|nr:hypothetical protein [Xenorhabdus hominickii]AOM39926.1 hypothetical protein A9255_04655 [Xenorhabdus hominickii]PHM53717.1 integrase [Xenorhabdus hominickii]